MPFDQATVDRTSHQTRERRKPHLLARQILPLLRQITDARSESKSQKVTQREDMICKTGRIRVMLFDAKRGLVIQQPIQDMGGISDRGMDDLGIKRRILIRHVDVKHHGGNMSVASIDLASGFAVSVGGIALRVRGGGCPAPPLKG